MGPITTIDMLFEDKIYKLTLSDYKKFQNFVRKNFPPKYILGDQKFLEWQYGKPPGIIRDFQDRKLLSLLVFKNNEKILGCLGINPLQYKVQDSIQTVNVYANLFIDPKLRQLGIGTLLIKKGTEGSQHALTLNYKPETFSIYQKLDDWRELGNFSRYLVIFNNSSVNSILKNCGKKVISPPRKFTPGNITTPRGNYTNTKTFNYKFDEFWKTIRSKYKITVERTSEYLNWRYASHPHFTYHTLTCWNNAELAGYLVYRIDNVLKFKIARVVDFVSINEFEVDLLTKWINNMLEARVDLADFMFSGNYHHASLARAGFLDAAKTALHDFPILFNPISNKKTYINFMALSKNKKGRGQFYDPSNWYLTRGDCDLDRPNPS